MRILRRLTDSFRHHHWMQVATDLVIVVVGVYLGIAAANLNQARIERREERTILKALDSDFHDIRRELTKYAAAEVEMARVFAIVEGALARGRISAEEEPDFRFGLRALVYSEPPPKSSGVLTGLMAGPGLARLSHPPLRTALFNFQDGLNRVNQQSMKFEELLRGLRARTSLDMTYAVPKPSEYDLGRIHLDSDLDPMTFYDQYSPTVESYDLAALRRDPQVRQIFAEARDVHIANASWVLDLRQRTDNVLNQLKSAQSL